jgi:hypothetical protein
MNLLPRINSISDGLHDEYRKTAMTTDQEPFEQLINRIETDISRYREYTEEEKHE